MSTHPRPGADRSWLQQEDNDFQVMAQPVSTSVAVAPRPAPVAVAPVAVALPRRSDPAAQQRVILAVILLMLLVALLAFFFFYQWLHPATAPLSSSVQNLNAAATAVAGQPGASAGPGCAALLRDAPGDAAYRQMLGQTYYNCGLALTQPGKPDVAAALTFFKQANTLLPGNADIAHQTDLATRYLQAQQTLHKPDEGGYIDQLEWFTAQAEFAAKPYADTTQQLYNAYIDSGNGYAQVHVCAQARHRFEQATALNFVDTTYARQLLNLVQTSCK